jgi:peptidoglycan/xylan/chitin deacetylase (PgdA/CDA1 family)
LSIRAYSDSHVRTARSRLLSWAAAGAIGLTSAGVVQSAVPASAAASPAAARPPAAAAALVARQSPVYTVHQILPNAPANAVALTIDDGPDPVWTPRLLALLRQYDVRATFCLVGRHAQAHPDLVRQIVAAGHALCNHTMTHAQPFSHRSAAEIDQQISEAQSAITTAAGTAPRLFRAPGGDWSPTVFAAAARHGLTPIGWNIDPRDWARPGTQQITTALLAAKPGDILLCHDADGVLPSTSSADRSETLRALQTALPQLKAKGYTFVTL